MRITHSGGQTAQGPADWFTGTVFMDAIRQWIAGRNVFALAVDHDGDQDAGDQLSQLFHGRSVGDGQDVRVAGLAPG